MINQFSAILSACSGPVALFADFDGTLVEIASRPDAIVVPDILVERLEALDDALHGALAIISGRTIADIDSFLTSRTFTVSGSHGAEQRHDGIHTAPLSAHTETARTIEKAVLSRLGDDDRILVERKPAGVAVHFRAAPERADDVRDTLNKALSAAPGFHAIEGKKVMEARPSGTDKGAAIRSLMERSPFKGRLPIFLGDDVTDEDGFRAVNAMGGISIKIGPGETCARFQLPDVASVLKFLDLLADHDRRLRYQPTLSEATK